MSWSPTFGTSFARFRRRLGDNEPARSMRLSRAEPLSDGPGYGLAVAITALATVANLLMATYIAPPNLAMVYLLGVAYVASRCSPGPAVFASVLSIACFNFFFVPPTLTFVVADAQYIFTFAVMLVVSLLISTLTVRLRDQSKARGEAASRAQIEKSRGDLLSAVSHDLRTPLASIEGSAGALLQKPELSEQSRQLAGTIQEESIRMARLIRNLLDMTRVQDTIDLDLDWYGLDELAANAIIRTEGMFGRPVKLTSDLDAPLVRVDGVLMEQVMVNLLENASRYAGRDADVEIKILRSSAGARLEVLDNGPGIAPEVLERVFERFHGEKKGGFGLGLAICRAAVQAHGGRIGAENRVGGGAKFWLELPVPKETDVG